MQIKSTSFNWEKDITTAVRLTKKGWGVTEEAMVTPKDETGFIITNVSVKIGFLRTKMVRVTGYPTPRVNNDPMSFTYLADRQYLRIVV